ncbi:unnamed protein product [Closterium sp. NIES-65]|nr:unnamed protein product [Closterium sp. NIES-65]
MPPLDSESGTWSAWGLSPREWGEVQSALRADTPSASLELGQQISAAQRSRGPDGGCGAEPSPLARADIRSASARAEEQPGLGPRRRGDRWSPLYGRELNPHSPGPAAPPPQTCLRRDRGQDPAGDHYRHDLRHSAGLAGRQNPPSEDAGGTARDAPNPSDVQATPSPSSPEIAAETVAWGIALGVSAGLPDHEETGGEENEDAQRIADRPHPADEPRDAQEMGAEERAAAEANAEASTRAPAAADRPGGSTQHAQGPTNTPARWGAGQAVGEESAPGQSGGRARLRRGAQGHAGEDRQAQVPGTRSPQIPRAPDPVSRMDPSPPTAPQPTPARQQNEDEVDVATKARRVGAAEGRGTRGIRVGCGSSRRARRGNGRGRRGGGVCGTNRRRTGASGYARTAERLIREGVEGGEEEHSKEAEDEAENEESEGGDPVFNPEREGMLEAEAEDEEELEMLLREAEFPNHQTRTNLQFEPQPSQRDTHPPANHFLTGSAPPQRKTHPLSKLATSDASLPNSPTE